MQSYVDPEDLAQDTEVKLLELQAERGYSTAAMSSPLLRSKVKRYVRMTTKQYDKARRAGNQDDIADHQDTLEDGKTVRRLNAWCVLADLPAYILVIGHKRASGHSITVEEWNHLRRFRLAYQLREEAHTT